MKEIIFQNDRHRMNWLRPDYTYAQVKCSQWLEYQTRISQDGDLVYTKILLTNTGGKSLLTHIGISFPLWDSMRIAKLV